MMVMIWVDRFSKIIQLVPLRESDTRNIADIFLSMVVNQNGLVEYIMSSHDPHFCGHFWDELMSLLDMTVTFSMASHPQTDGVAEVINCTMESLLWIIEKLGEETITPSYAH